MKLGWCICLPGWPVFLYNGLAVGSEKGLFEVILFLGHYLISPLKPPFVITFKFNFMWENAFAGGARGVCWAGAGEG